MKEETEEKAFLQVTPTYETYSTSARNEKREKKRHYEIPKPLTVIYLARIKLSHIVEQFLQFTTQSEHTVHFRAVREQLEPPTE